MLTLKAVTFTAIKDDGNLQTVKIFMSIRDEYECTFIPTGKQDI